MHGGEQGDRPGGHQQVAEPLEVHCCLRSAGAVATRSGGATPAASGTRLPTRVNAGARATIAAADAV